MLTVNSKARRDSVYLFESRVPPVTAEELAQGEHIGTPGTLESTLTLAASNPPLKKENMKYGNKYLRIARTTG